MEVTEIMEPALSPGYNYLEPPKPKMMEVFVNKAERGFSVPAQAAKPSETWVVYWGGHPSKY